MSNSTTLAAQYARAIYEAHEESATSDAEFIANVMQALKRRHHAKILPQILEEYRKYEMAAEAQGLTLRLAQESERQKALAALKELDATEEKEARTIIDQNLIKGFVVEGKDFRYDASAKRTLIDLYKRLIAST